MSAKRTKRGQRASAIALLLFSFVAATAATGAGTLVSVLAITTGLYFLNETRREEYR